MLPFIFHYTIQLPVQALCQPLHSALWSICFVEQINVIRLVTIANIVGMVSLPVHMCDDAYSSCVDLGHFVLRWRTTPPRAGATQGVCVEYHSL